MKVYFLSKDANWQHYRNETLSYLGRKYNANVEILTTGHLKPHLKENEVVKYKIFKNVFSQTSKMNFFPGAIFYILKNRPDCVLALNNSTNITEYVCVLICRLVGIRFVWWTHGFDHKPVKNSFLKYVKAYYVKMFLSMGNAIVTFSDSGRNYLIGQGLKAIKIHVAPNTLDTEKLELLRAKVADNFSKVDFMSKHFGPLTNEAKFVLFSGRINHYKKVENLVRSMNLIVKRDKNVHLIIVGDGPKKEEVVKVTQDLEITNNIHFMGSVFDDEEMARFFLLSDVFVIPGLVGLAIVHAFSYGKPILTERVSYHSPEIQYLHDGYNGYFINEDDIDEMANKILMLLNSPEKLSELSRNALATAAGEAAISNMIGGMYAALKSKEYRK